MDEGRKSRTNFLVIAVTSAVLVTFAFTYLAGYFVCCEQVLVIRVLGGPNEEGKQFKRLYQAEWISMAYRPMAYAESIITRKEVTTGYSVIAY